MPDARRLAVLSAPLRSSLRTLGVEASAGPLRTFAVAGASLLGVEATDAGEVQLPPPGTDDYVAGPGVPKNEGRVRESLAAISAAVAQAVRAGSVPVLFGGDSTVVLGLLAGLSDGRVSTDRCGLLALDGAARFQTPADSPPADLASMVLSLATGHGPPSMTHLGRNRFPLVQESDIILAGVRDALPAEATALVQTRMTLLPPDELAGTWGLARFTGALGKLVRTTRGVVVHVDASVFDPKQFPVAAGSPSSGGLSGPDCKRLVDELAHWDAEHTIQIAGISVSGVDARKDPGGVRMHELAALSLRIFQGRTDGAG